MAALEFAGGGFACEEEAYEYEQADDGWRSSATTGCDMIVACFRVEPELLAKEPYSGLLARFSSLVHVGQLRLASRVFRKKKMDLDEDAALEAALMMEMERADAAPPPAPAPAPAASRKRPSKRPRPQQGDGGLGALAHAASAPSRAELGRAGNSFDNADEDDAPGYMW